MILGYMANRISPEDFHKKLVKWFQEKGLKSKAENYVIHSLLTLVEHRNHRNYANIDKFNAPFPNALTWLVAEHMQYLGCFSSALIFKHEALLGGYYNLKKSSWDSKFQANITSAHNVFDAMGIDRNSSFFKEVLHQYSEGEKSLLLCICQNIKELHSNMDGVMLSKKLHYAEEKAEHLKDKINAKMEKDLEIERITQNLRANFESKLQKDMEEWKLKQLNAMREEEKFKFEQEMKRFSVDLENYYKQRDHSVKKHKEQIESEQENIRCENNKHVYKQRQELLKMMHDLKTNQEHLKNKLDSINARELELVKEERKLKETVAREAKNLYLKNSSDLQELRNELDYREKRILEQESKQACLQENTVKLESEVSALKSELTSINSHFASSQLELKMLRKANANVLKGLELLQISKPSTIGQEDSEASIKKPIKEPNTVLTPSSLPCFDSNSFERWKEKHRVVPETKPEESLYLNEAIQYLKSAKDNVSQLDMRSNQLMEQYKNLSSKSIFDVKSDKQTCNLPTNNPELPSKKAHSECHASNSAYRSEKCFSNYRYESPNVFATFNQISPGKDEDSANCMKIEEVPYILNPSSNHNIDHTINQQLNSFLLREQPSNIGLNGEDALISGVQLEQCKALFKTKLITNELEGTHSSEVSLKCDNGERFQDVKTPFPSVIEKKGEPDDINYANVTLGKAIERTLSIGNETENEAVPVVDAIPVQGSGTSDLVISIAEQSNGTTNTGHKEKTKSDIPWWAKVKTVPEEKNDLANGYASDNQSPDVRDIQTTMNSANEHSIGMPRSLTEILENSKENVLVEPSPGTDIFPSKVDLSNGSDELHSNIDDSVSKSFSSSKAEASGALKRFKLDQKSIHNSSSSDDKSLW